MKSVGSRASGLRLERMKASSRWAGDGFANVTPILPNLKSGPMPALSEFLCGGKRRSPAQPLPSQDPRADWSRPPETGLRATWLGHSTVLLEVDGARLLTDPVWGERASPVSIVGPKRFQPVPVGVAGLPALDAVLISHDHYDHLDYPTLLELAKLEVPFVTSLGVGAHLESWGIEGSRITELDWWESVRVAGVTVTATPSQHFSGRGVSGRNGTLWSSFVIQGPSHACFFSGDTGLTAEYREIRERFPSLDLVMLEVGAFHPAWGDIHLGPENALVAFEWLGGKRFLPIHWGTFNLALHAWDEPAEVLLERAPRQGAELLMPRLGQAVEPRRVEGVEAWWRSTAALEKGRATAEPKEPEEETVATEPVMWPLD
jgi:L-ascorbate metabolism protein UlaG (beta-lactamase superfamily)